MRRALFVLMGILALWSELPAHAQTEVTKLDATVRQHLLQAKDVSLVRTMHEIPARVVQACATSEPRADFRLADAGQRFQETDVLVDKKLLLRRLIWAAQIPGYYVVHYEEGGFAYSVHLLVVAYDPPKTPRLVWEAAAKPYKTYGDFVEALKSNKLNDPHGYHP